MRALRRENDRLMREKLEVQMAVSSTVESLKKQMMQGLSAAVTKNQKLQAENEELKAKLAAQETKTEESIQPLNTI